MLRPGEHIDIIGLFFENKSAMHEVNDLTLKSDRLVGPHICRLHRPKILDTKFIGSKQSPATWEAYVRRVENLHLYSLTPNTA